jgi:hypothetical protein
LRELPAFRWFVVSACRELVGKVVKVAPKTVLVALEDPP